MKRILFPTDFSEVADNAFVHALELANTMQAELILLHSFELPIVDNQYFPQNYMMIYESMELSQFDMFKEEIPKLRAIAQARNLGHIRMSHRLMDGDLVYNVGKAVEEDKIDFVVMGTSGGGGWESFFFGSNAGNVISDVTVPMLCVPQDVPYHKIKTIGFTTRFRDKDKKALKRVLKIAHKTNAKIKCLYVKKDDSDVDETKVRAWEKEFEKDPITFLIVFSNEVTATILDFMEQKSIDVLTMLTYKRGFFESLFHTSLTKKIATGYSHPVLVIPID
ncbi:universal stress protein [Flavobacterium sp. 7A]|uniref:universal stress protein n=1 Tax=Flavobacterium sp. 7A TaxID=2940571 RepID=UPI00222684C9|nr:universal stress protein [Flavobacterium sp. 7A]MCW2120838.1 nucleotide-binding universal stress UspA family protein [Flavobacterium sp. 7A]